jgi:hypothetical protein
MRNKLLSIKLGLALALVAAVAAIVVPALAFHDDGGSGGNSKNMVVESAMLAGLPSGALYPFIDSTPSVISSTHIALTDETDSCSPGAAPPKNLVVLVGEAGVALVPVMTAATNTGIGSPNQCVFHVTVRPGPRGFPGGMPVRITDVVVVNGGDAPLTAWNTVTVSAEIQ